MTKEELSEKRKQAIKSLNDVGAILGLDEMYIDELEKENADLRDNYDQFKAIAEPEIERLQKKNAELKHNKKTVAHLAGCLEEKMKERIEELETRCTELFLQNNEFAEHLTKATEIIKGLLSCCRNYPQENAEKVKQAEQFLNYDDDLENCRGWHSKDNLRR